MIHKVDAFWVYGPMFRRWCIYTFWTEVAVCATLQLAKMHVDLDHDETDDTPREREHFVAWFVEGWER